MRPTLATPATALRPEHGPAPGRGGAMARLIGELSMSLDGFVADPQDQVGPLFDWYGNGPVETPCAGPGEWTFRTSAASAGYLREALTKVGAVIGGRRVFEV